MAYVSFLWQTDGLVLSKELQAPASIRCHYENVLFDLVGHGRDATGATVARGGLVPGGCFGRVKIFIAIRLVFSVILIVGGWRRSDFRFAFGGVRVLDMEIDLHSGGKGHRSTGRECSVRVLGAGHYRLATRAYSVWCGILPDWGSCEDETPVARIANTYLCASLVGGSRGKS